MSWTCPYERDNHCKRLKRTCKPGIKGCVLYDKVKFIDLNKDESLSNIEKPHN